MKPKLINKNRRGKISATAFSISLQQKEFDSPLLKAKGKMKATMHS